MIKEDQEADLRDEKDHEVDLAVNITDILEAEIVVEDLEADLGTESANVPEADQGTDLRRVIDIIVNDHMNVENLAADHLRMEEIQEEMTKIASIVTFPVIVVIVEA